MQSSTQQLLVITVKTAVLNTNLLFVGWNWLVLLNELFSMGVVGVQVLVHRRQGNIKQHNTLHVRVVPVPKIV
jgi:hypothetical protein